MSETLKRIEFGNDSWIFTSESWEDGYQPYTTGESAQCECGKPKAPHWHHRCSDGEEFTIVPNLKATVVVVEEDDMT